MYSVEAPCKKAQGVSGLTPPQFLNVPTIGGSSRMDGAANIARLASVNRRAWGFCRLTDRLPAPKRLASNRKHR